VGGREFDKGLDIVKDRGGTRTGTIGAAHRQIPYWTLLDRQRRPWARLSLWFRDEGEAVEQMWTQLKREFPLVLPHGIVRRLRDVEISAEASVVKVGFDQRLILGLQDITCGEGGAPAPAALLSAEFDVARIVRQEFPTSYELIVVTEEALARGLVHCSPGREFVFGEDRAASSP
jgi:hypothetical protein